MTPQPRPSRGLDGGGAEKHAGFRPTVPAFGDLESRERPELAIPVEPEFAVYACFEQSARVRTPEHRPDSHVTEAVHLEQRSKSWSGEVGPHRMVGTMFCDQPGIRDCGEAIHADHELPARPQHVRDDLDHFVAVDDVLEHAKADDLVELVAGESC